MPARHVIIYDGPRVLIDRHTLAHVTNRSIHTIRAKCQPDQYRDHKALYDLDAALQALSATPTRTPARADLTKPKTLISSQTGGRAMSTPSAPPPRRARDHTRTQPPPSTPDSAFRRVSPDPGPLP